MMISQVRRNTLRQLLFLSLILLALCSPAFASGYVGTGFSSQGMGFSLGYTGCDWQGTCGEFEYKSTNDRHEFSVVIGGDILFGGMNLIFKNSINLLGVGLKLRSSINSDYVKPFIDINFIKDGNLGLNTEIIYGVSFDFIHFIINGRFTRD